MRKPSRPSAPTPDPLAALRARGLVTPPRSKRRDTSKPTIKPKDGPPVGEMREEWR